MSENYQKVQWCVQCGELKREIRRWKLKCSNDVGQRFDRHSFVEEPQQEEQP